MNDKAQLGGFLREVSNWDWSEFVQAEKDQAYSTSDSIVFSLIRAIAMEKMDAIRIALNRLDGKLVTPVNIEYPKVFYIFPNAKTVEGQEGAPNLPTLREPDIEQNSYSKTEQKMYSNPVDGEVIKSENLEFHDETDYADDTIEKLSLRETLRKMSEYPRTVPDQILEAAQLVEDHWRGQPTRLPDAIPRVKSVITAHLLKMAQNRKIDAFYEVFDQIDGKLVETIKLLGDDVHIPNYSLVAPEGAYLNKDGIYQMEATQTQNLWTQRLQQLNDKR